MRNEGKLFEQDFAKSVPPTAYIYRLKDNAASFSGGDNVRFTSHNMCDYFMFDDISRTLYCLELKSCKSTSISYSMIRKNQIEELTLASEHNLVAGFVCNFREKDNYTAFIDIKSFNKMREEINKKSFNINDLKQYGCIEIPSEQKRIRYKYDIENFIKQTQLNS